jgi:hypothetical protein
MSPMHLLLMVILALASTIINGTHMSGKPTLDETKVFLNNIFFTKYFELLNTEISFPVHPVTLCKQSLSLRILLKITFS